MGDSVFEPGERLDCFGGKGWACFIECDRVDATCTGRFGGRYGASFEEHVETAGIVKVAA